MENILNFTLFRNRKYLIKLNAERFGYLNNKNIVAVWNGISFKIFSGLSSVYVSKNEVSEITEVNKNNVELNNLSLNL